MNYYIEVLKKYAVFSGRATRSEYWYFILFYFIFSVVAGIVDGVIGSEMGIIGLVFGLAMFIPSLAVAVRRLHDIGKSGWMILVSLIPLAGAIWIIILLATDSQAGENEYGANPKMSA